MQRSRARAALHGLKSRFARRVLGEGVKGAMQNALKMKTDRFARECCLAMPALIRLLPTSF